MLEGSNILVTGCAGFIGFHLTQKLSALGYTVIGVDNLNDYYDVNIKHSRLEILREIPGFTFYKYDLSDREELQAIFAKYNIQVVVNLAAQAGVRYSLENPHAYVQSNIHGFMNILELCRAHRVKHLLYASSSSVYGANKKVPFSVHDPVDHPISLYAASKKANELMAHTYSALFNLPTTGLRFFTVYGPFGRPDMALFIFTKAILENRQINIYNHGKMRRDFTYVDDIVEGISRLINQIPAGSDQWNGLTPDPATSFAPYRIYNIGNSQPVNLMTFVEVIEKKLNKKAIRNYMPLQEGDVPETSADISDLEKVIGFRPSTPVEVGVGKFIDWYLDYYKISAS
jgi:UDP-glucuronate 4-epimerase